MALGGQVSQDGNSGGGILGKVSQYWPALNSALERNKALATANEEKQLELEQKKAIGADVARNFGGYDPQKKIYWDGPQQGPSGATQTQITPGFDTPDGRVDPVYVTGHDPSRATAPANPFSAAMSDPMVAMAGRLDPKGVLSNVLTQAFAPPTTYQITSPTGETRSQLLTRSQATALQKQGYQIAESDKAKPTDPNTAPTFSKIPGANNREQTVMWRPGMGAPTAVGAPGAFVNRPTDPTMALAFDAQNFMGGGQGVAGHQGSGAPQQSAPPQAAPSAPNGSGVMTQPATQPAAASPVFDPVAATDRSTIRRPWLQDPTPTSSNQPVKSGGVPTVADIVNNKLIQAARPPEEQKRLDAEAAATVKPFGYDKEQADKDLARRRTAAADQSSYDNTNLAFNDLVSAATALRDNRNLNKSVGSFDGRSPSFFEKASNVDADINNLKGKVALSALQSARQGSATGATGFGALSEGELKLLENSIASLDMRQDETQFREKLNQIITHTRALQGNLGKARDIAIGGGGGGWSIERVN